MTLKKMIIVYLLFLIFPTVVGCSILNDTEIQFSLTRIEHDNGQSELGERTNVFTTNDELFFFSSPLTGKTGKYMVIVEKDGSVVKSYSEEFEVVE